MIRSLSLFSGCMGLDLGLELAGIHTHGHRPPTIEIAWTDPTRHDAWQRIPKGDPCYDINPIHGGYRILLNTEFKHFTQRRPSDHKLAEQYQKTYAHNIGFSSLYKYIKCRNAKASLPSCDDSVHQAWEIVERECEGRTAVDAAEQIIGISHRRRGK